MDAGALGRQEQHRRGGDLDGADAGLDGADAEELDGGVVGAADDRRAGGKPRLPCRLFRHLPHHIRGPDHGGRVSIGQPISPASAGDQDFVRSSAMSAPTASL